LRPEWGDVVLGSFLPKQKTFQKKENHENKSKIQPKGTLGRGNLFRKSSFELARGGVLNFGLVEGETA